jgi:hypothetical protein
MPAGKEGRGPGKSDRIILGIRHVVGPDTSVIDRSYIQSIQCRPKAVDINGVEPHGITAEHIRFDFIVTLYIIACIDKNLFVLERILKKWALLLKRKKCQKER